MNVSSCSGILLSRSPRCGQAGPVAGICTCMQIAAHSLQGIAGAPSARRVLPCCKLLGRGAACLQAAQLNFQQQQSSNLPVQAAPQHLRGRCHIPVSGAQVANECWLSAPLLELRPLLHQTCARSVTLHPCSRLAMISLAHVTGGLYDAGDLKAIAFSKAVLQPEH